MVMDVMFFFSDHVGCRCTEFSDEFFTGGSRARICSIDSGSHTRMTFEVDEDNFSGGFYEKKHFNFFGQYSMYFEHTLKLVGVSHTSCNKC